MEIKRNELGSINTVFANLPLNSLSIDQMLLVMEVSSVTQKEELKYQELRRKIFLDYGIKQDREFFAHEKFVEISEKIRELDEKGVELEFPAPFLSKDEFGKLVKEYKEINVNALRFLKNFLLKES